MTNPAITSIDTLKAYLYRALILEHATIPPYLTALYSIRPQTNSDASHILRVVVVEEMLHLTIAANLMNAIGGSPDLTKPDFVPEYPTYLPDGETDFKVGLECFSPDAIDTFLKIERPSRAPADQPRRVSRRRRDVKTLAVCPDNEDLEFFSIGDFYNEIKHGFEYLYEQRGPSLFSGDPRRQVTSQYYYSGGGELNAVTDMASARAAIDLVIDQGEGHGGKIYDTERELAHFYRFEQLKLGRYYQPGDEPQ
ncbi:MAG: ferritin-like protein, partial [Myxococcota bacterium]